MSYQFNISTMIISDLDLSSPVPASPPAVSQRFVGVLDPGSEFFRINFNSIGEGGGAIWAMRRKILGKSASVLTIITLV